jgi:hypothetical protein
MRMFTQLCHLSIAPQYYPPRRARLEDGGGGGEEVPVGALVREEVALSRLGAAGSPALGVGFRDTVGVWRAVLEGASIACIIACLTVSLCVMRFNSAEVCSGRDFAANCTLNDSNALAA